MRRVRLLVLVAAVCLALAACRIDTTVAVRVGDNGSGTVTVSVALDADAVRAAQAGGKTLEDRVRLADLVAAGWQVSAWRATAGGGAVLRVRHHFSSPAEMTTLFAELDGSNGPLRAVRLVRDTALARTTYRFHGVADLAGVNAGVTDDNRLVTNLAAQHVDATALDAKLTKQLRTALRMQIAVSLPGDPTHRWVVAAGQRRVLAARSTRFDPGRAAWTGLGVLLGAIALGLVFIGEWRARRRRKAA